MEIKIETSARHIHLTAEDYKLLFGDKAPSEIKKLSQGKEMACEESVTAVGPKSEISKVRLLVPFRDKSQLEISKTDSFVLGIDAPLKISGDLPGANIKIIGPAGTIEKEMAIVAKRHLHFPSDEAQKMGLANNDVIDLRVSGDRGLTFSNVIVRVGDMSSPAIHVDTDESNAAGISTGAMGEIILNS